MIDMFFATREIRRSLGRFVLLAGAVGLLVLLLVFFQTVGGALVSSLTGAVANQSGEILVYDARARLNPVASVLAPDVVGQVASVDGVARAGPVAVSIFTGTVDRGGAGTQSVDVALWAAEPGAPGLPTTAEPDDVDRLRRTGSAVLGSSSFDQVLDGDDVVALQPGDVEVRVVGTAEDAAFNAVPTLYTDLDTYRAAVRARTGTQDVPVSLVAVTPVEGADIAEVAERITAQVPGVRAVERSAAVGSLPGVGSVNQSFAILDVLLYIVVTIVTGVFFLILTVQKRDALVLLRAVGARRRDVVVPVLLQVVVVVGVGVLVGTGLAVGLLSAARDTFGASVAPVTVATSGAVVLALGLVAALGAVRKVVAIEPVEAVTTGGLE